MWSLFSLLGAFLSISAVLCRRAGLIHSASAVHVGGVLGPLFGAAASVLLLSLGTQDLAQCWLLGREVSVGVILIDRLSTIMLVVVSIIGAVVARYSLRCLEGNQRSGVFLDRLLTTFAAIQVLVVAGDLVLFSIAWLAVSLSLHGLLNFFPDRVEARMCARKKFFISRIGDVCLVGAIGGTFWTAGTASFRELASRAELFTSIGFQAVAVLVVLGALTKSAQFPFHSWLPESLETPTPVSAFMHAGIINAGGYLVLRTSPLIAASPAALGVLAVVGGLTAALGMTAMVTQTSIKKRLAYSTIGQMGFMTMQCGLGHFQLALVHMVAHAFYKAYAFLRSGSAVDQRREEAFYPVRSAATIWLSVLIGIAAAVVIVIIGSQITQSSLLVGAPLGLAATFAAFTALLHGARVQEARLTGLGAAVLVAGAMAALSSLVTASFPPIPFGSVDSGDSGLRAVSIFLCVLFTVGFLVQIFSAPITVTRVGKRAFVHLHNGLYVSAFFNRALSGWIGDAKVR
jgi:NAD(P)H-quinone oxidoreductase subunit 5